MIVCSELYFHDGGILWREAPIGSRLQSQLELEGLRVDCMTGSTRALPISID